MGVTHEFHRVPVEKITVPTDRQRAGVQKVEELADSIKRNGLFHPIILRRDHQLVAGACRLAAYRWLGEREPSSARWKSIQAQYADELSPSQLLIIELEENIRRTDLTWQEQALAILAYTEARGEDYSANDAAADLGMGESTLRPWLQCARALRAGDAKVLACETFGAARNFLHRKATRAIDSGMMEIMGEREAVPALVLDVAPTLVAPSEALGIDPADVATSGAPGANAKYSANRAAIDEQVNQTVQIVDFLNIAPRYDGPKFNLIHCDFPYGIGYDSSDQGKAASRGAYADSDETFWRLFDCLIDNQDRLLAPSAHIMFWFHMKNYERLRLAFGKQGWFVNPLPLIWHKADNIGIVPDSKRRPRQVYETAFLITVGDRPLVAPYPNCVSERSGKRAAQHISQKAAPMLHEHFRGLVDESTVMLDPTCGSGTALAAAILHKAKFVLGWEINPEYAQLATTLVFDMRVLRFDATRKAAFAAEEDEDVDPLDTIEGPTDEELAAIEREAQEADTGLEELDELELEF